MAVAWTTNHINQLNEGGAWMVPRANAIYTFHHSKKEYRVRFGAAGDPDINRVLKEMGWTNATPKPGNN